MMLKTQDGTKFKVSRSTGDIFFAVDDAATCDRPTNVFGKRECQSAVISPVNTNYGEANKQ